MNFKQISIAALLAVSGIAANATIVGAAGGTTLASTFIPLVAGGDVVGRAPNPTPLYTVSSGIATRPSATVGSFIAAGPTSPGNDVTFTLPTPSSYVSFDWGSVDSFNTLYVFEGNTATPFTASSLGLLADDTTDAYVHFTSTAGSTITALVFESTANAFEASNFSVTAVPEPSNIALMLAGLGAFGLVARKRRI